MKECNFCKGVIKDTDAFCKICGYDPKTDTISPNFIPLSEQQMIKIQNKKNASFFRAGISPGVKKFVFIGLAVLVFSIFYKNNFDIGNVVADLNHSFTMVSKGKFDMGQEEYSKGFKRASKAVKAWWSKTLKPKKISGIR
jgi:hypothetical protein